MKAKMKEAKKFYDSMLASGDLEILFPSMTGEWDKDKDKFIKQFNKTQNILNNL